MSERLAHEPRPPEQRARARRRDGEERGEELEVPGWIVFVIGDDACAVTGCHGRGEAVAPSVACMLRTHSLSRRAIDAFSQGQPMRVSTTSGGWPVFLLLCGMTSPRWCSIRSIRLRSNRDCVSSA